VLKKQLGVPLCVAGGLLASSAALALPVYDHIVIVIEENEAPEAILGSADAPYINALAAGGASFSGMYAVTHPSQPNYLHLFSGENQGVTGDGPISTVFTTPNLGAELLSAGKTFAGYFEDLPAAGSTIQTSGMYSRRHNPIVDWQSSNPGPNQYGPMHNLPLTSFPSDFNQLPTVSFVVPNVYNDMHDGPISNGDEWLRTHIGSYADWAKTHNSLLVLTWDEDDFLGRNRIVTIFSGQGVKVGEPAATWTHHNLLRTIEEMYGTAHAGAAKNVRPIVGAFAGDAQIVTSSFQQGTAGYAGVVDTHIESASPNATHATDTSNAVTSSTMQGLIRFDNLFGNGLGQVPLGAKVLSAKLLLVTTTTDTSTETISLHAMISNWSESSTWNSLGGGVSADDVEANSVAEFKTIPNVPTAPAIFDVTRNLEAWAVNPAQNRGWVLRGSTPADIWRFRSSQHATLSDRPILEVSYERQHWGIDASGQWNVGANWISGLPAGAGAKANFLGNISAPRTIGISAPITIGSISFESEVSYTLAGAGITLAPLPGVPSGINAMAGKHAIVADVNLADDASVAIADGAQVDIEGALSIAAGKTVTKSGAGMLRAGGGIVGAGTLVIEQGMLEPKHFNGLVTRFSAGGRARIIPDGTSAGTSKLAGLEFGGASGAWEGQFDLTNNAMVVVSEAANRMTALARLADQIGFARNSGETIWSGEGLTSSFAADSGGLMTLGILLNDDGAGAPFYNNFQGQPANANSILVKYTLVGDLDLDGDVDADDYSRIDAGYAQHASGYWNGDVDYSGRINADDFFAMDRAFSSLMNRGGGVAAHAAVPEPPAMGVAIIVGIISCLRIRRVCFNTSFSPAPARDSSPPPSGTSASDRRGSRRRRSRPG
jgi:hypothetical protein